ncbi:polyphosphate kinase 2 [Rhizobium straminoryzae]|uniref:ADP/GDP-polyphosphate phosphotransferase n=1 Tax=Rhizobium straminoryzae TaxID=1387186 RepID=A0A549TGV6_9HYPH|nr:polyphosphate kinase 2 [Rhizobium straminoryzae]TRL42103.1 polyphosphate kinase 2 [Rhizobium straminoryzae]
MNEMTSSRAVTLDIGGERHVFDIDDPTLPKWISEKALSSGGYPYDKKLDDDRYEAELRLLQIELVKVQSWLQESGERVMALFEGRDAAGKGGSIFAVRAYLNPREARVVALPKPTPTEAGQWYFQRYVEHFPTAGEIVLFDRSWYNRAVVEPVMGFCTPKQHRHFLKAAPVFEKLIVDDGIHFFKFWLDIGREMQLKRFHDRRHDPLKIWKLSPMDIASLDRWKEYGEKRDQMLEETHTDHAPWTVVRANDKRRARLSIIRHLLDSLDYTGKDSKAIGQIDKRILDFGPKAFR